MVEEIKKREIHAQVRPFLGKLSIVSKRLSLASIIGGYKSTFKGRGLEFDGYTVYDPSEDAERIDWKASLRAAQLLMKDYVEEREVPIFFIIDVGDSMVFGSTEKLKNEYVIEVVAALSFLALEAGDSVGYAIFANEVRNSVQVSKDKKQIYVLSKFLFDPKNYGGGMNLTNATNFALSFLKKRAIVIIVSDFIGLEENWKDALKLLSTRHDMIGIMVRDPRDFTMPDIDMRVMIRDPRTGDQMLIEPSKIKKDYEEEASAREQEIEQGFRSVNSDFLKLRTDVNFVNPIIEFFRKRGARYAHTV